MMKNKLFKILAILISIFTILLFSFADVSIPPVDAQAQTVRFVSPGGIDIGECDSSQTACKTIQYAVFVSNSGDTIKVAEGTYRYDGHNRCMPNLVTKAVVCIYNKTLTIQGGFSSANWSYANPITNPTIIDGAGQYRGVVIMDSIHSDDISPHLEMTGFTIQNARAFGPNYSDNPDPGGSGAGMFSQRASLDLSDMIFKNNEAIGANVGGETGSGGSADGAGLRIEITPPNSVSFLTRVSFENNISRGGSGPDRGGVALGALFIWDGYVVIEDSNFLNNKAIAGNSQGSGLTDIKADALGGGIAVETGIVDIIRTNVTGNEVTGGNASQYGGGGFGGGIFVEEVPGGKQYDYQTIVRIIDSYVTNNKAKAGTGSRGGDGAGGGVDVDSADMVIERSHIMNNSVAGGNGTTAGPGAGGGIYLFAVRDGDYYGSINNSVVAYNTAAYGTGGGTNPAYGGGAGIVIQGVDTNIYQTTIAYNKNEGNLALGTGLLVVPFYISESNIRQPEVNLVNSIISNHSIGKYNATALVTAEKTTMNINGLMFAENIQDRNTDPNFYKPGIVNGLETIINAPSVGYVAPQDPYYNFHLRLDANARDKGNIDVLTNDLDNQLRPQNGKPDFGADEFHPFNLDGAPRNGTLLIDWKKSLSYFLGGADNYRITVQCDTGANPPDQINCGGTITNYPETSIFLTGLSNHKSYTVSVWINDSTNIEIGYSNPMTIKPSDLFVNLPLIIK